MSTDYDEFHFETNGDSPIQSGDEFYIFLSALVQINTTIAI